MPALGAAQLIHPTLGVLRSKHTQLAHLISRAAGAGAAASSSTTPCKQPSSKRKFLALKHR
jgi:hypothetical protein